MSSDDGSGSDLELQSALPKKNNKKMPKSPSEDLLKKKVPASRDLVKKAEDKKLTTKSMITLALVELNTRKGVSLYAIKKYLNEKFNFDTEKNSYLVKKTIKKAIEDGLVTQTKGVGASGSFKIAPVKEKKAKTKKKIEKTTEMEKSKKMKKKVEKTNDGENKEKKEKPKKPKTSKNKTTKKNEKSEKKVATEKAVKVKKQKDGGEMGKKDKLKMSKSVQTPAKRKAAMMKRKSIGSIIKPPKMKPKAKA